MSSKYYGSSYDPRFRNSYMSQEAWAVTDPIFATPLSRRPCQPDMGSLLIAHTLQRAVVMPPPGQEGPRTFLVTALGHSISRVNPTKRVCGLDVHRPHSFVPVAGVFYCQGPPNLELVRHLAANIVDEVESSEAELVIFNGIWSGISQFLKAIQRLAATRHLIVADDFDPAIDGLAKFGPNPVQVMAVSQIPGKQGLIHVDSRLSDSFHATK